MSNYECPHCKKVADKEPCQHCGRHANEPVKRGHDWAGWPGCYCQRCGAGQVLEIAVAEGWLNFGQDENGNDLPETWRSDDHKELVRLCDSFCYADMTPEEVEAHKAKIKALQERLGV